MQLDKDRLETVIKNVPLPHTSGKFSDVCHYIAAMQQEFLPENLATIGHLTKNASFKNLVLHSSYLSKVLIIHPFQNAEYSPSLCAI